MKEFFVSKGPSSHTITCISPSIRFAEQSEIIQFQQQNRLLVFSSATRSIYIYTVYHCRLQDSSTPLTRLARDGMAFSFAQKQTKTKHTSTLCPSPRISVRICLDSRPPSHHSMPGSWASPPPPIAILISLYPSPRPQPPPPFLATSSVRRIYPRCGQRHVTWIESVIVSCADAVVRMPHLPGRLVASPHVPPIRAHPPHHSVTFPLYWPVSTGCPGFCIPKTTAEFKTIIIVYILALGSDSAILNKNGSESLGLKFNPCEGALFIKMELCSMCIRNYSDILR